VGEVGALALSEPELSRALVRAFGAPNGGLVSPADFAHPEALDWPAQRLEEDGSARLVAPWADSAKAAFVRGATVSAIDINGLFVSAAFECQPDALYVEELELSAPLLATPTMRGVPRVAPGTPLAAAAPIWIDYDAGGSAYELWSAAQATHPAQLNERALGIRRNNSARTVEAV